MFYTYVLLCIDDKKQRKKFYTGVTNDLQKRFKKHLSKSVKTTKSFDIVELVYYEACKDKADAERREIQLKTGYGRGFIKDRILNYLKKRV